MNEALLAHFQKAYQALDLFPLLEPQEIQAFRVDYGKDVLVQLKQENDDLWLDVHPIVVDLLKQRKFIN